MTLNQIIILVLVLLNVICHESQVQKDFLQFFEGCRSQLTEWVGFAEKSQQLITKCKVIENEEKILQIYLQLTQIDISFNLTHFDLIRKYLKQDPVFKQSFKCIVDSRNTQNEYFNEQKKFKHFGKFVKQHSKQGKFLFVQQQKMWKQKGKKLCNYFKAFFEFYYLNVLKPSETLSTTFLRALTVRTDIFDNEDIAYCVDLDTHGTLVQNLDGLDINNIYVKIPQIMNAIRFLKFKKECKSQKNLLMMKKIKERLKNLDMFKIMYHDYQPFVEVAAEKFGTTQLKLLARKFAHIIENVEDYDKFSSKQL